MTRKPPTEEPRRRKRLPAAAAARSRRAGSRAPVRKAKYALGQVVRHRVYAFRGVVFDIDPVFNNTEEWWLSIPENVRLVYLPPYCPELNPIERVWRDLKEALAWLQFPALEGQQDYLATLLRAYEAATLQSLTR